MLLMVLLIFVILGILWWKGCFGGVISKGKKVINFVNLDVEMVIGHD
jgi:hypothetical protein